MPEIGGLLQYIAILIAVWQFTPEYVKLKTKLTGFWPKFLFFVSLALIFLLNFGFLQPYYNTVYNYLAPKVVRDLSCIFTNTKQFTIENRVNAFFGGNAMNALYFLLRIIQLGSILAIYYSIPTLKGRKAKLFEKLIHKLYDSKQYNILTQLIGDNLGEVLDFELKLEKRRSKYKKYSTPNIRAISGSDGVVISPKDQNVFERLYAQLIVKLYIKEIHIFSYLTKDSIIDYIADSFQRLGYFIMDLSVKEEKYLVVTKDFIRKFVKRVLLDRESVLSESLTGLQYEPIETSNMLINLISIGKKLDFGKVIDETLSQLIKDPKNKDLLNQPYTPGTRAYCENSSLVSHLYNILALFTTFGKTELDLGNMPIFTVKELCNATDRSLYEKGCFEFNTATYYLLYELFERIERRIDNIDSGLLTLYFTMYWMLLSNKEANEEVKANLCLTAMHFVCNGKNKKQKITALNKFRAENQGLIHYFQLDIHDAITLDYRSKNKDVFQIVGIK